MRVLICGSRTWSDANPIMDALAQLPKHGVTIIEGGAQGADRIARHGAKRFGFLVETYPADWQAHGRAAGPIRNQRMIDDGKPDKVIAFRCAGRSSGTDDMVRRARAAGIPVQVIEATS